MITLTCEHRRTLLGRQLIGILQPQRMTVDDHVVQGIVELRMSRMQKIFHEAMWAIVQSLPFDLTPEVLQAVMVEGNFDHLDDEVPRLTFPRIVYTHIIYDIINRHMRPAQ